MMTVALTSCSTQRVFVDGTKPVTKEQATYSKSQSFFVYGIGQTKTINAKEICGQNGIAEVTTTQTFVNGLLGVVTFGIFTPRTVIVNCN